jgi:hypothetical protein
VMMSMIVTITNVTLFACQALACTWCARSLQSQSTPCPARRRTCQWHRQAPSSAALFFMLS